MKIAIHQPEHFPYMGFFEKLKACDVFVLLDDVQYKKNNFQNRNRFLNKQGIEEWFTVQIEKGSSRRLINEIKVSKQTLWKEKIINKLKHNFKKDYSFIYDYDLLVDINKASIEYAMKKMKIEKQIVKSSDIEKSGKKTELLISICKSLGASSYVSGIGGKNYLDIELFKKNNIELNFINPEIKNIYSVVQYL